MAAPPPAIEVSGHRKAYGAKTVLDGVDLAVPQGSIYALLGPNGAGKTTIVDILTTLLPADSGTARILGEDVRHPDRIRPLIGVTGQFAAVRGVTYSGGMRRRLDLAMTLVAEPRVLFLDGQAVLARQGNTVLDPRSRHALWDVVRDLTGRGVTIFLTTQYLEEADQLADRIGVLDHGALVAEGTADELKRRIPGGCVRLEFSAADQLAAAAGLLAGAGAERDRRTLALRVPTDGGVRSLRTVLDRLDDAAVEVAKVSVLSPDLDDVFLALTGRPPIVPERPAALTGRPDTRKEHFARAAGRRTDRARRLGRRGLVRRRRADRLRLVPPLLLEAALTQDGAAGAAVRRGRRRLNTRRTGPATRVPSFADRRLSSLRSRYSAASGPRGRP